MAKTTKHENAKGIYFWTSHQVTKVYQVIEKRYVGSVECEYLLSTGKNIKASFNNMEKAVQEAFRRQEWIDAKAS